MNIKYKKRIAKSYIKMSCRAKHCGKKEVQCCCQFAHFWAVTTESAASPCCSSSCRRKLRIPPSPALARSENACCTAGSLKLFFIAHFQAENAFSIGVSIGEYGGRYRTECNSDITVTARWHGALSMTNMQGVLRHAA